MDSRLATLISQTVLQMLREDPKGFTAKAAEKFRSSGNPVLKFASKTISTVAGLQTESNVARLISEGALSEAISYGEKTGNLSRSDRFALKQTKDKLERLETDFEPGVEIQKVKRVLHFLTNSVPHTQSGYTLRSHKVLQAQSAAGLEVKALTRLAYPVVIGKLNPSQKDVIDGIVYKRALPTSFPESILERDRLTVDLLVTEAKAFGADALQTTTDFGNAVIVSRAAAILNIPWVYEVRGELESTWASTRGPEATSSEFYEKARNAETRAMKAASAVIVLSDVYKNEIIARGIEPEKIHVIPNAIEDSVLEMSVDSDSLSLVRNQLGIAPNDVVIGTATSVVSYEGLDTLTESLDFLPSNHVAVIVGDGVDRPRLEKLANERRVHFVGKKPQSEILDWYALFDVFAIPRKNLDVTRKVTPIKGLQAQALGKPIVASDLPALREVTGGNQYYVDPEDPEALAQGILEAYEMGPRDGVDWAAKRTWSANGKRYGEVFGL